MPALAARAEHAAPRKGRPLLARHVATLALLAWWAGLALAFFGLTACATVRSHSVAPLRAGEAALASTTAATVRAVGLNVRLCTTLPDRCIASLTAARSIAAELRLAAIAELALVSARAIELDTSGGGTAPAALERYVVAAHAGYAYLLFTHQSSWRADDQRDARVRDLYNLATERFTELAFALDRRSTQPQAEALRLGAWQVRMGNVEVRLPYGVVRPEELLATRRLRLRGIRSVHTRTGVGAVFVAVAPPRPRGAERAIQNTTTSPIESQFIATTTVLKFSGATLDEVLATRTASLEVYDPIRTQAVRIGGAEETLAGNFTAPYALWLARSNFARQARFALLRPRAQLNAPRIYLMQPFDPERRTLVLLHGLGASPEAWANVANDVLGDDDLRERYQIWQVFYPTNLPLPENRRLIREALLAVFAELDPAGQSPASRDVTLIGHSMGGVLARLLVVESGDALWNELFRRPLKPEDRSRLAALEPYLTLEPLPNVTKAVFIAAPHGGSPLASGWRGWLASHVMRLPHTMVAKIREITVAIAHQVPREAVALRRRGTSIDSLSDRDPYLQVTAELPIARGVTAHSIVGRSDPTLPLEISSDGVVPYASAHLEGAASELVVTAGHAVQDTLPAILEIRRILRGS